MRWQRWVAATFAGLALAMAVASVALLATQHLGGRATGLFAGLTVVGVITTALGLTVSWRIAGNVVGVLLTLVGANVVYLTARDVYYRTWLADHSAVPLNLKVVAVLGESAWWLFAALSLLFVYFPDGRVPSRRWRAVPALIAGMALVTWATGIWETIPFPGPMHDQPRPWSGYPLPVEVLSTAANASLVALGIAAVVSLVLRFRRSTGVQRSQLKLLSLAGLGIAFYPLACGGELLITGSTDYVAGIIGVAGLVTIPVAVAVAMLRHELYDFDRVAADTITYAAVVAVLAGAYAATALTLGLLVGRGSALPAAGATIVCALLLTPLRSRLRRSVDGRLFPPRRAAAQAIEDLQRRVHTQGAQPEELEAVLKTALRDPGLRVGMLVPGTSGLVDATGAPVEDTGIVPIMLGGVQIGALTGSGATSLGVLRVVASACASLVEVTRLRAELARALREVEASRARLIQAGDAERRRLERDLHDGAQQRLVSLGMAMRLAQRRLPSGEVDVDALIDQGVAELATAIAELRQIAHGLRPSSLDDGLHAALAALTSRLPLAVRLDVPTDTLDDDVATTAYFVAAEAIVNAAKHANASTINVRVVQQAAAVSVRVQDDGVGGAEPRSGSGLSGLADRVQAIGGSLSLSSPAGQGTTIEAVLPCGS